MYGYIYIYMYMYICISGVDFEKNFQGGAKINGGVPVRPSVRALILKAVTKVIFPKKL